MIISKRFYGATTSTVVSYRRVSASLIAVMLVVVMGSLLTTTAATTSHHRDHQYRGGAAAAVTAKTRDGNESASYQYQNIVRRTFVFPSVSSPTITTTAAVELKNDSHGRNVVEEEDVTNQDSRHHRSHGLRGGASSTTTASAAEETVSSRMNNHENTEDAVDERASGAAAQVATPQARSDGAEDEDGASPSPFLSRDHQQRGGAVGNVKNEDIIESRQRNDNNGGEVIADNATVNTNTNTNTNGLAAPATYEYKEISRRTYTFSPTASPIPIINTDIIDASQNTPTMMETNNDDGDDSSSMTTTMTIAPEIIPEVAVSTSDPELREKEVEDAEENIDNSNSNAVSSVQEKQHHESSAVVSPSLPLAPSTSAPSSTMIVGTDMKDDNDSSSTKTMKPTTAAASDVEVSLSKTNSESLEKDDNAENIATTTVSPKQQQKQEQEQDFSGLLLSSSTLSSSTSSKQSSMIIVLSVVAALGIVVCIITGIIIVRRRRMRVTTGVALSSSDDVVNPYHCRKDSCDRGDICICDENGAPTNLRATTPPGLQPACA